MTEKQKDDIYYVCSLIEFIARKTKNHRQDVIRYFSKKDIQRQLRLAEVNHCLSFEQVADELIEDYGIKNGDFDTVKECKYEVPSVTSIGMLYQELVLSTMKEEDASQGIIDVFHCLVIKVLCLSVSQTACLLYHIHQCLSSTFLSFFRGILMFVCRSQATCLLYHMFVSLSTIIFVFFKTF